jgi:hypothetical protein
MSSVTKRAIKGTLRSYWTWAVIFVAVFIVANAFASAIILSRRYDAINRKIYENEKAHKRLEKEISAIQTLISK